MFGSFTSFCQISLRERERERERELPRQTPQAQTPPQESLLITALPTRPKLEIIFFVTPPPPPTAFACLPLGHRRRDLLLLHYVPVLG